MTVIWHQNDLKLKILKICFVSLLTCSAFLLVGLSNTYGAELYSKNDKPFGISLDGWMDRWWTWWITTDEHESTPKPNGCIINQNNSMIMLMDTTAISGTTVQICEISSQKGIIVPLWTGEWEASNPVDENKTFQELTKMARGLDLGAITSFVKLDGSPVSKLDVVSTMTGGLLNYKINSMDNVTELYSKGFNITIPKDTHYPDMIEGTWRAGAHGWFVFLKPLEPGDHKLEYNVGVIDEGGNSHSSEISYYLKVK